MSSKVLVTRPGEQGVVETSAGPRPATPRPKTPEGSDVQVTRAASKGAGAAVLPNGDVRSGTPQPKTAKTGGRRRTGRKTRRRHRKHRGGGQLSVVEKNGRWYIRETSPAGDFQDSEKNWATKEDAESMVASLQKIKDATPDQEERKAIAVAASGLANMKTRGGRRRHH